jgi:hypothetical protein
MYSTCVPGNVQPLFFHKRCLPGRPRPQATSTICMGRPLRQPSPTAARFRVRGVLLMGFRVQGHAAHSTCAPVGADAWTCQARASRAPNHCDCRLTRPHLRRRFTAAVTAPPGPAAHPALAMGAVRPPEPYTWGQCTLGTQTSHLALIPVGGGGGARCIAMPLKFRFLKSLGCTFTGSRLSV